MSLGAAFALVASAASRAATFEVNLKRKQVERKLKLTEKKKKIAIQLNQKESTLLKSLEKLIHSNKVDKSDLTCPECQHKMSCISLTDKPLHYCVLCKSCWFDNGVLQLFTGFEKDCPSEGLVSRESRYSCPYCSTKMREYVFMKPHNLLVDKCVNDHGVYLENGEFERSLTIVHTSP